jgi:hypothetical protein
MFLKVNLLLWRNYSVKVGQNVFKKFFLKKPSVRREPRIAGLDSNVMCLEKLLHSWFLLRDLIFDQLNYGVEKIVSEGTEYKKIKKIITFYLRLQNDEGSDQT